VGETYRAESTRFHEQSLHRLIHKIPSSPRTPALAARNQLRGLLALSRREVGGVLGLNVSAHVIRDVLAAIPAFASR